MTAAPPTVTSAAGIAAQASVAERRHWYVTPVSDGFAVVRRTKRFAVTLPGRGDMTAPDPTLNA